MKLSVTTIVLILTLLATTTSAGPALYGICQAGCAAVVVACYGAAGATFGTIAAPAAPAAVVACNSAFGICSAKCALATLVLPTP